MAIRKKYTGPLIIFGGLILSYWLLTLQTDHKGFHAGMFLAICIATLISFCSYVIAFRQCRDMGCGAFLGVLYSYAGVLGLVFFHGLMTTPSELGWFPIVAIAVAIYGLPLISITGIGTYLLFRHFTNNAPNKTLEATGDSRAGFFDETRPRDR